MMLFKNEKKLNDIQIKLELLIDKSIHQNAIINKLNNKIEQLNLKIDKDTDTDNKSIDKYMLQEFFNNKLLDIEVSGNGNEELNIKLDNLTCNLNKFEELNIKLDILTSNVTKLSLKTSANEELYNKLDNITCDILKQTREYHKTSDISLRTDLQTFLVNLQSELSNRMSNHSNTHSEKLNHIQEQLDGSIKQLLSITQSINTCVNGFYYDNELIKHQLLLEDDMRKYNDEIENVKILANNIKNMIDNTLNSM